MQPSGNSDRRRTTYIAILVASLLTALPLELGSFAGAAVACPDLVAPLALPALLRAPRKYTAGFVLLVVLALFSAGTVATISETDTIRPWLSIGYFFKPMLLFFAGYRLLATRARLVFSLKVAAAVSSAVATCLVIEQVVTGVPFLLPGEAAVLGLTFLGIPLFGATGVNALAVTFVVLGLLAGTLVSETRSPLLRVLYISGGCAVAVLVAATASRQAMIGLAIGVGLILMLSGARRGLVLAVCLVAVGCFVVQDTSLAFSELLRVKLQDNMDRIHEREFGALTTGRLELAGLMVEDLVRNPITGNGFHGFQLFRSVWGSEDVTGVSPHQQYLGAFWKMGIVGGAVYLAFLSRMVLPLWRLRLRERRDPIWAALVSVTALTLVWFCMVQDALTFPLTGSFLMWCWGGAAHIYASQPQPVVTTQK